MKDILTKEDRRAAGAREYGNATSGESSPELAEGTRIESEHALTIKWIEDYYAKNGQFPPDEEVFKQIAVDHLDEFKDYYSRLKSMEGQGRGKSNAVDGRPEAEDTIRAMEGQKDERIIQHLADKHFAGFKDSAKKALDEYRAKQGEVKNVSPDDIERMLIVLEGRDTPLEDAIRAVLERTEEPREKIEAVAMKMEYANSVKRAERKNAGNYQAILDQFEKYRNAGYPYADAMKMTEGKMGITEDQLAAILKQADQGWSRAYDEEHKKNASGYKTPEERRAAGAEQYTRPEHVAHPDYSSERNK